MKIRKMTREEAEYEQWINSTEYHILLHGRNYG